MSYISSLPEHTSLEVYQDRTLVFSSSGKWLHPLLELETFLSKSTIDPGTLSLHDRIIGRAAAALIITMRIQKVHADILSDYAKDLFNAHGTEYISDTIVEKITCKTEHLITADMEVSQIRAFILQRISSAERSD